MPSGCCKSWHGGAAASPGSYKPNPSRMSLERATAAGDSPVGERARLPVMYLSTAGHEKPCGKLGGPSSKAKYSRQPIVDKYREGKVKSTPGGE